MNIIIGSDHRGFKLKQNLIKYLSKKKYSVKDAGTGTDSSVDYPKYALKVGKSVAGTDCDLGIAVCGSGIGICIAVNKVNGVRAGTARSVSDAEMMRKHNNANVVCMGADETDLETAKNIVDKFITTDFEGGRHTRRVNLIKRIEKDESR